MGLWVSRGILNNYGGSVYKVLVSIEIRLLFPSSSTLATGPLAVARSSRGWLTIYSRVRSKLDLGFSLPRFTSGHVDHSW